MAEQSSNSEIVAALAEEFVERYRKGERPPISEYVDKHPDLADDIKELFPALVMLEGLVPEHDDSIVGGEPESAPAAPMVEQLGDYRILREVGRGGMGVVYEAEQISLGRHVALKVLPQNLLTDDQQKRRFEREAKAAARLHHTNIVPVFGIGEHDGMHYYVMQFIQGLGLDEVLVELKRMQKSSSSSTPAAEVELPVQRRSDVAAAEVARSLLTGTFHEKLITGEPDSGQQRLERTAAALSLSPSIAKISAPGKIDADSSTARLAQSGSISLPGQSPSEDLPHSQGKKLNYWQSVATMGVQVASALQHAHDQGVQHRDVKPSNLLLDLRGTVWVTDFGLAKTDDQQNITHTGDILGTLRYMPPEAFEGKADHRGDAYSLGITLYELLALKPAFDERDRNKLIKQVTQEAPMQLQKLNTDIPRDLATIIHKAIERDPNHRYQSPNELADDLQRFIDDEPIKARRTRMPERIWRWTRHNKRLAASMVVTVLALLLGTGVATWQAMKANKALKAAKLSAQKEIEQREIADQAREQARQAKLEALEALNAALRKMQLEPNNPSVRIMLAKQLLKQDLRQEAKVEFEKALALDPQRVDVASDLAKLMLLDKPMKWSVLRPVAMRSNGSATFTPQQDGSVLVSGANVGGDTYVVQVQSDVATNVRAIRLEVLPDESLPQKGPGRHPSGNFHVATFRLLGPTTDGASQQSPIAISSVTASYAYQGSSDTDVAGLIDKKSHTVWHVWGRLGQKHHAEFVLAKPIPIEAGKRLTIVLEHPDRESGVNLGRFRISVTSQPFRSAVLTGELKGFAALAAAYLLEGSTKKAMNALDKALRRADSSGARAKILDRVAAIGLTEELVRLRPEDPAVRVALARKLMRQNRPLEARPHLEKALALEPKNADAASELGNLIVNHANGNRKWTLVKPTEMKSKGGATLTLLGDGSILAGGVNPHQEQYTIRAPTNLKQVRAVKLECLPHPSLPKGGSGRDSNGSFFLHEFTLGVESGEAGKGPRAIRLHDAFASHSRTASTQARHAIDGNLITAWDPWPKVHEPLEAIFTTTEEESTAGKTLVLGLVSKSSWPNSALGCFRLWVTSEPSVLAQGRLRLAFAGGELNGFAALAVARQQEGNSKQAIAALVTALDQITDPDVRADVLQRAVILDDVRTGLLSARPKDPVIRIAVAQHLQKQNLWRAARAQFESVLALDPTNVSAASGLANLMLESKQFGWSILQFAFLRNKKLRQEASELTDPWQRLAAAYYVSNAKSALDKLAIQKPETLLGIARILQKDNRREEARAQLEKALSLAPENVAVASDLANLLLVLKQVKWTVLEPVEVKATGGEKLTRERDGSVFVSGPNPDRAIYTLRFKVSQPYVRAIRIETLPDPRLVKSGAGRCPSSGDFRLAGLTAEVAPAAGKPKTLKIAWAMAEHARPGSPVANALDGKPETSWSTVPRQNEPIAAVFGLETPAPMKDGSLILTLDSGVTKQHGLGRFRVSALSDAAELVIVKHRMALKELTSPWERLAVAYYASNNQAELNKLVSRKPACLFPLVKACAEAGDRDSASAYYAMLREPGVLPGALVFDGRNEPVTADHVPFDTYDAFTVEAWVRDWKGLILEQGAIGDPGNGLYLVLGPSEHSKHSGWRSGQGKNHDYLLSYAATSGWRHVAMTFDGKRQCFFSDGRLLEDRPAPKPGPLLKSKDLTLGGRGAQGLLGAVRISKVARYEVDFTPSKTFKSDAETVLLYDLSQAPDGVLLDQSPKKRHGKLHDPRWLVSAHVLSAVAEAAEEFNLGATCKEKGDLEGALGHYQKAIVLDVDFALAHCRLGLVYRDQRKFAQALKCLQQGHDLGGKREVWPYPSAQWLDECKVLLALDKRASLVLQGKSSPKDASELVTLAVFARQYLKQQDAAKLLQQAIARDPKHARAHCELGLLYRDQGKLAESLQSLQKGHELGSKDPNWKEPSVKWVADTVTKLGNSLLSPSDGWKVLKPVQTRSQGGEKLTLEKDGSIFVSGPNPDEPFYALRFRTDQRPISAIRLETLPDRRLLNNGSGRFPPIGNFLLTEFKASIDGKAKGTPIPISWAVADYAEAPNYARHAIDGNPETYWTTYPLMNQPHSLVLGMKAPVRTEDGFLVITLDCRHSRWKKSGLGRFRLSVLSDPAQLEKEKRKLQAQKLTDPWSRLAAAHYVNGDKAALDKLTMKELHTFLALAQFVTEWNDEKRATEFYQKFLRSTDFTAAMVLNGRGAYVTAPHVPFDTYNAFTVEAWVAGWDGDVFGQGLQGEPENSISLELGGRGSGWEAGAGTNYYVGIPRVEKAAWRHVAMTYDGKQRKFFLDGQLVQTSTVPKPGPLQKSRLLNLAVREYARETGPYGKGLLAAFRISNVARYSSAFTPSKALKSDSKTVLLYDLSQANDKGLQDQSGNERHGMIHGPRRIVRSDPGKSSGPKP